MQNEEFHYEFDTHLKLYPVFFFPPSSLQNAEVSVFEVNIRFVGGLLSAYYLSGKEVRNFQKVPCVFADNNEMKNGRRCLCCRPINKSSETEPGVDSGD